MAKTQDELNTLKNEYETLNNKLSELTEEELKLVTGGTRLDADRLKNLININAYELAKVSPLFIIGGADNTFLDDVTTQVADTIMDTKGAETVAINELK